MGSRQTEARSRFHEAAPEGSNQKPATNNRKPARSKVLSFAYSLYQITISREDQGVYQSKGNQMHAHNAFFTLNDTSAETVQHFIDDSKRYLAVIPGIKSFACGVLEAELNREVNDREFDVSIHVLFENRGAHDAYQKAPSHNEFVERNEYNWASVRVFDSAVK